MTADPESLEALVGPSDYDIEIELTNGTGETEAVVCRKLGFGMMAEAAAFVKEQRRKEYTAGAVHTDLLMPQVQQMHAEVLRGIACTNVGPFDVINDPAGRVKLCQLAINKAKGAKGQLTYEQTVERLAHVDVAKMFRKLCLLSGIYVLEDQETKPADPCATPPSTSPDAAPSQSPGTNEP